MAYLSSVVLCAALWSNRSPSFAAVCQIFFNLNQMEVVFLPPWFKNGFTALDVIDTRRFKNNIGFSLECIEVIIKPVWILPIISSYRECLKAMWMGNILSTALIQIINWLGFKNNLLGNHYLFSFLYSELEVLLAVLCKRCHVSRLIRTLSRLHSFWIRRTPGPVF